MRWLLIGASTIAAQYMIRAIRAQAGSDVVRVVTGDAERGREYAQQHGIAHVDTDLDKALATPGIDAVYISSTNEKHYTLASQAIAAGKHVLCEKPLAMSLEDAVAMVRAAEAAGVVFATNHHLRCSGSHQAVKDLIESGRVGRVLSLRLHHAVHLPENLHGWRINSAGAGGGVILDITVHDADVARFLLTDEPDIVVARNGVSGMGEGVEDSAMSVWTMRSGAMVMSHESFTHPFAGTGLEVHGSEGSIFARGVMTQQPVGDVSLVTASGEQAVSYSDHDLYTYAVSRFDQAVAGSGSPAASGWDGVRSLAVALAVQQAAISGNATPVDSAGASA